MREIVCDVAVIGAGTAGIAAHRAALDAGATSILIERGPGGTTCARVGCMPSKLVIAAAHAAHGARGAGLFGVHVETVRIDGPAVMERVRAERDRFVGGVFDGLDDLPEGSRLAGEARFEDAATLTVGDHTRLTFRAAVIATGSSPSVPEPLKDLGDRVLTTDTLFEIETLPESLAVIGGGAVGLEMAQAFARLGVRTLLFDPGAQLGTLSDPDLVRAAREIFGQEIDLRLGAEIRRAERSGQGVTLHWSSEDGSEGSERVACVLAAAGRPPNLSRLGLERAGLRLDEHGTPAFDPRSLACEGAPIFVAGDANHARPLLHEASRQGRIAGANAAALVAGRGLDAPAPWPKFGLVFTHPQIAVLGSPYDGEAGDRIVGEVDGCDQGRSRIEGVNQGGMRLYADRSGRLIGAEMIGPAVEHIAHIVTYALQDGLTAQAMLERPFYHPTVEEGLQTALRDVARQVDA